MSAPGILGDSCALYLIFLVEKISFFEHLSVYVEIL